jgi:vacuolar-type H+-ATPase subunit F/Vma7
MSRLLILTRPNLLTGFQLTGIEAFAAGDAETAQELIGGWLEDGEEGLLAIDEDILACMEPAFLKRLQAAPYLPYLVIPGVNGASLGSTQRRRIAEMIRQAIGFHITFKSEEAEVNQR